MVDVTEQLNKEIYNKIKNKKGWLTDEELNVLLMFHQNAVKVKKRG